MCIVCCLLCTGLKNCPLQNIIDYCFTLMKTETLLLVCNYNINSFLVCIWIICNFLGILGVGSQDYKGLKTLLKKGSTSKWLNCEENEWIPTVHVADLKLPHLFIADYVSSENMNCRSLTMIAISANPLSSANDDPQSARSRLWIEFVYIIYS